MQRPPIVELRFFFRTADRVRELHLCRNPDIPCEPDGTFFPLVIRFFDERGDFRALARNMATAQRLYTRAEHRYHRSWPFCRLHWILLRNFSSKWLSELRAHTRLAAIGFLSENIRRKQLILCADMRGEFCDPRCDENEHLEIYQCAKLRDGFHMRLLPPGSDLTTKSKALESVL